MRGVPSSGNMLLKLLIWGQQKHFTSPVGIKGSVVNLQLYPKATISLSLSHIPPPAPWLVKFCLPFVFILPLFDFGERESPGENGGNGRRSKETFYYSISPQTVPTNALHLRDLDKEDRLRNE